MDIRKADSKGRLTGFEPNVSYWVESGSGVTRAVRVVPQVDIRQPILQAGMDYLRRFGLGADELLAEGADSEGAWRVRLTADGSRVLSGTGLIAKEWTPWPEGFDYDEFVRLANGY